MLWQCGCISRYNFVSWCSQKILLETFITQLLGNFFQGAAASSEQSRPDHAQANVQLQILNATWFGEGARCDNESGGSGNMPLNCVYQFSWCLISGKAEHDSYASRVEPSQLKGGKPSLHNLTSTSSALEQFGKCYLQPNSSVIKHHPSVAPLTGTSHNSVLINWSPNVSCWLLWQSWA